MRNNPPCFTVKKRKIPLQGGLGNQFLSPHPQAEPDFLSPQPHAVEVLLSPHPQAEEASVFFPKRFFNAMMNPRILRSFRTIKSLILCTFDSPTKTDIMLEINPNIMGQYLKARERRVRLIQDAFWNLYEQNDKVTVDMICDSAGINRSTFYYYFKNIEDVLDSIKLDQISKLNDVFVRSGGADCDYTVLIPGFQQTFDENKKYLIPLVIEYKDPKFSMEYRSIMTQMMMEHLKIICTKNDKRSKDVLAVMVPGLVNMFLDTLASYDITYEEANLMSQGIIHRGLKSVLWESFGIHIGFESM